MLVIPGGGLNGKVEILGHAGSFNPLVEFADSHRCVALDIKAAEPSGEEAHGTNLSRYRYAATAESAASTDGLAVEPRRR